MRSIVAKPDFRAKKLTFGEVPCFSYKKDLKRELAGDLTAEDAILWLG